MSQKSHSLAYRWWADVELDRVTTMILRAQSKTGYPIRSILHIGVGEGNRLDYWLTRFVQARHIGVDIEMERVESLPQSFKIQASGESLPFRNSEFDLVIGISTFHHFQNPRVGMLECLRVGRTLVVMEPLKTSIVEWLIRIGIIRKYEKGERIHRFNLSELRRDWFDEDKYRLLTTTYLHKHISFVYQLLDKIDSEVVVSLLRSFYRLADWLLTPLHTKGIILVDQRGGPIG
jgi:ubiquinone/menaquinone biosynthesis C-methylase UbiE